LQCALSYYTGSDRQLKLNVSNVVDFISRLC
jgi:hypothetical protein